ncbi:MAG: arginine--tRNA ligase, partial [Clostridia bacterium]|nr:arginine--tRNA ligase [Clostridia bacterium]
MEIKKLLANAINLKVEGVNYEDLIIESVSADKGDYCLPCFALSKALHKSPMDIANEIGANFLCDVVEKCEVQSGYLNFFLKKDKISEKVLAEYNNRTAFETETGKGKVVCVDYGSPNLAKFLHIGHLKSLIEGESLCRLLELNGYQVKRLDFTGDYGVPFGKILYGRMHWGSKEDVMARGNDALQEYYVKFNQAEAEDESLTQVAKDLFKKISDKDPDIYPLYEFIIDISLASEKKAFLDLGVKFDDKRGEMYYEQFVPELVEKLKQKGLLKESLGSLIVDLDEFSLGAAVIVKNGDITLYLTRDIAAAVDRYKDYKYDKLFYVTDVAQVLHFDQLKKVLEVAGYSCYDKVEHVPYGRFSLPDGKISSRRGKQAVLVDLLEYAENKAKDVIANRTFTIEKPEDVISKVAASVRNYSVLKVERGKDWVFDAEKAFRF